MTESFSFTIGQSNLSQHKKDIGSSSESQPSYGKTELDSLPPDYFLNNSFFLLYLSFLDLHYIVLCSLMDASYIYVLGGITK